MSGDNSTKVTGMPCITALRSVSAALAASNHADAAFDQ